MKALTLIALVLSTSLCVGASSEPKYIQMTTCQIVSQQHGKSPQLVEIEADLFNGMPHGLFIGDTTCARRKIQIDYKIPAADPSIATFDKYVSQNFAITGLIGHGRFCGSIRRDPTNGRLNLIVKKVLNFQPKGLPSERPSEPPPVALPPSTPQPPVPDEAPIGATWTVR